jgi:hypothetical protein
MAGSTAKKVVIRRFDRETLTGFVNPLSYLQPEGVELLRQDGTLTVLSYREIRSVAFVKDFDGDPEPPRVFLNRPKLEGLWVRMVFLDGEVMDGILANNLLSWEAAGITVTPPEPDSNNQKVFVPREGCGACRCLAWWGVRCGRNGKKRRPGISRRSFEEVAKGPAGLQSQFVPIHHVFQGEFGLAVQSAEYDCEFDVPDFFIVGGQVQNVFAEAEKQGSVVIGRKNDVGALRRFSFHCERGSAFEGR